MKPKDTELQRRSGSAPVLGSGTRAGISSPPLRPGDREPVTLFELARRSIANPPPGETPALGDAIPLLPPSSPWAADPVPSEPTIDRSEDGDVMGTPIDQLP
jgi:hypothetical protein